MKQVETVPQMPVLYLPHGGGPLPLLGDPRHETLIRFLKEAGGLIERPDAILMVSAHWEEEVPVITSSPSPELIYDYYGFPEASYDIQYPASGSPELSDRVLQLLLDAGINSRQDSQRGFDHGMFAPLKLMYPKADIPCVQLSILQHLDPKSHVILGKSISKLREEGVLIIGSGMSFHNMKALLSAPAPEFSAEFDQWLIETCTDPVLSAEEREQRLLDWENAPQARYCHPREEHLLPLHVCFGAALAASPKAELVHHEEVMGNMVSGLLWR